MMEKPKKGFDLVRVKGFSNPTKLLIGFIMVLLSGFIDQVVGCFGGEFSIGGEVPAKFHWSHTQGVDG